MPITLDGLVAEAEWVTNDRNAGSTYDPQSWGYPWRIVLHTIEGSANRSVIAGHQYPPHLWYDPATRKLYQTVPLGRGAFALYQDAAAPHYTNRARALQVEIAGRSAETPSWSQEWLDNITTDVVVPLCQWVAARGASINLMAAPAPGAIPNSATVNAPQRLTPLGWALANTLLSHRHVPMGDDHWDTGALDTPRIAQHAGLIIAGMLEGPGRTPIPTEDDDDMAVIFRLVAPGDAQHHSMWAIDGVFKRKLTSWAEYEHMVSTNQVRRQPNGAGWADVTVDQLRPYATVDEWSLAGLATVPGGLAHVSTQIETLATSLARP